MIDLDRIRAFVATFWLPLAVAGVGVGSIGLLLGLDRAQVFRVVRDAEAIESVSALRTHVAESHLWLEELVTGDEVDEALIDATLETSLRGLAGLLESDGRSPAPLDEPGLRRSASDLELALAEFRSLTRRRLDGFHAGDLEAVGVGSPLDVEYDRIFATAMDRADELHRGLLERRRENELEGRRLVWGAVAGWAILVAAATIGLFSREARRREAEVRLQSSREQLVQSQRMEAMGRLAGGIAHDVNNYLAAIRGHCELLRMKRGGDEKVVEKMDIAIRVTDRAAALIERLLAFSHRRPLELDVVDPSRVIRSLERVLEPSLGEAIDLELELSPNIGRIRADVSQLEQVIVNLIVNARDAMPDGGTVRVRTADGDGVRIEVEDNGCGIPSEMLGRVFEPFVTTKETKDHSGLGLSVVYGIVQQHGGRIDVKSRVGQGTTVSITLPRVDDEETWTPRPSRHGSRQVTGTEHLLLVDDNDEYRQATAALLEGLGYRVTAVAGAEEALARWRDPGDIDLVLTDVVMPGLTGLELATRLRTIREVPIVLVSGHDEGELLERHGDPGWPMVRKLGSVEELAGAVRAALEAHR